MCVLIVGVQWHEELPLVVGANRDEELARPASLPEVERLDGLTILRPLDLRAGGTWEGINSKGLLAVITNRRDGDFAARRRSRGLLCREVLGFADTQAAESHLAQAVRSEPYNSFNLLYADRRRVCLSTWNGELRTQVLGPGTYVLSNQHGLGELSLKELEGDVEPGVTETFDFLEDILASHAPRDAEGFRLCKHGERYGTVSSSLLFMDLAGRLWMKHAAGLPCRTPFEKYPLPGVSPPR